MVRTDNLWIMLFKTRPLDDHFACSLYHGVEDLAAIRVTDCYGVSDVAGGLGAAGQGQMSRSNAHLDMNHIAAVHIVGTRKVIQTYFGSRGDETQGRHASDLFDGRTGVGGQRKALDELRAKLAGFDGDAGTQGLDGD
jgi:hypothetical protein